MAMATVRLHHSHVSNRRSIVDRRRHFNFRKSQTNYNHYLVNCSLNATDFLERMRGKRLIFVGDSLNRNMWESLVCILRQSIPNKKNVYEISGRMQFKTAGYYGFKFKVCMYLNKFRFSQILIQKYTQDYDCSIDFVRSTFLVRNVYVGNGKDDSDERLRLDLLDDTTRAYRKADVIVFNTGHWWTHEKTSKGYDFLLFTLSSVSHRINPFNRLPNSQRRRNLLRCTPTVPCGFD